MIIVAVEDGHQEHHSLELDNGELIPSWDAPSRVDFVKKALTDSCGKHSHSFVKASADPRNILQRVHSLEYVEFLRTAFTRWKEHNEDGGGVARGSSRTAMASVWPSAGQRRGRAPLCIEGQLGYYSFTSDCGITAATWQAALGSAATAMTAAQELLKLSRQSNNNGDAAVFALCRPPGHHAMRDRYGGYCYFNNACVAAQTLLDEGEAITRVLLLDVDYHHGNGSQDILYERSDVLFASLHADPAVEYPYFSGYKDETGKGVGLGMNRNVPLPLWTDFETYVAELDKCAAWALAMEPRVDAMVVSLGVDTFEGDPIGRFCFKQTDYSRLGTKLRSYGLPAVLVLEGGYISSSLGTNVASVITGFERGAGDSGSTATFAK
jgi:acetoin utilization deacetylase AcuC-like enzyme